MKLGSVTKLDNRNKKMSKEFDDGIMLTNCDVTVIFQFMANLEESGSWIRDSQTVKLTFSLRI